MVLQIFFFIHLNLSVKEDFQEFFLQLKLIRSRININFKVNFFTNYLRQENQFFHRSLHVVDN